MTRSNSSLACDRQIGWSRAFENAAGIYTYLAINFRETRAITDEAAVDGIVTKLVDARQTVIADGRCQFCLKAQGEHIGRALN
jgi:hypothetical protein